MNLKKWLRNFGNKKSRPFLLVGGLLAVIVIGVIGFEILGYAGGWETTSGFKSVDATSTTWSGSSIKVSTGTPTLGSSLASRIQLSDQYVHISTSGGEKTYIGSAGYPSGPADIAITKGATYHAILTTTGKLQETSNPADYIQSYSKTINGTTYFYELHYYAFQVEFRTLAAVYNNINLGGAHEGQVAGSFGMAASVILYVDFKINPWDIVGANAGTTFYDRSTNSTYRLVDGWAGIMLATVWSRDYGGLVPLNQVTITGGSDNGKNPPYDNGGGFVKGAPTGGQQLSMYYLTGSQAPTFQYNSPSALRGVPQEVLIQVPGGSLLAGSYINWAIVKTWITALDVNVQLTIVVQVLQVKGYQLIAGKQETKQSDDDYQGQHAYWWDELFASIGANWQNFLITIVVFFALMVGLYFVAKVGPRYFTGRKKGRKY